MTRLLAVTLALLPVSLMYGCFEDGGGSDGSSASGSGSTGGDTASSTTSDSGTSTSGGCTEAELGCDCYPNGTCNSGLICEEGKCVAEGCTQGSFNCGCFEGMCFDPLVCVDGVCKTQDGTTTGGTGGTGGCMSVSDCDDNLCTVGDELCNDQCVGGGEISCPADSMCDPTTGSCVCGPGFISCGGECIPDTQCCTDADCGAGEVCDVDAKQCTCDGGLICDGVCVPDAACCPGTMSTQGCSCGGQKLCSPNGVWGSCLGGNDNPKCTPGANMPCGSCGTQTCTAQCEWGTCQGGGVCSPGAENCTAECKFEVCSAGCYWQQMGVCC